jgi:hypothetical protein
MDDRAKSKKESKTTVDKSPSEHQPWVEEAKRKPEKYESEKLSQDDDLTKRGHD